MLGDIQHLGYKKFKKIDGKYQKKGYEEYLIEQYGINSPCNDGLTSIQEFCYFDING